MSQDEIVIVGGARTAMAEWAATPGYGAFQDVTAIELGAHAVKGALQDSGVIPEQIGTVVIGNVVQSSPNAIYGARHVALESRIPIEIPALTVNRLCGSGMEAIIQAAHAILLGEAEFAVAGGMENLSQAPHVLWGARKGFQFGQAPKLEDYFFSALHDSYCGFYMAQTAENLARKFAISRQDQDTYALRSHKLSVQSVEEGLFDEEIVPVVVRQRGKDVTIQKDDHIKPDTNPEALAKLRPAFGKDGTVTAGNASGIVDAACVLIVTSRRKAEEYGLKVKAFVRQWGVVGVPPEIMGIGPVPAIRRVLERSGLALDDIDFFEINEAFAAQYLACERELGLDRGKVNVNGGAIGLGHPLGATGARLVLTLERQLHRARARYGIAAACIGGGQGIAMLLERA
ncbi:MAG: thiolase family protein [Planctomycetes bacterium]|nr:thiolase family protein [Planctomycetota bacterium]